MIDYGNAEMQCEQQATREPNRVPCGEGLKKLCRFSREANRKAFEQLKSVLSSEDFIDYVANGSVIVQGKYGVYEIFRTFRVSLFQLVSIGEEKKRPIKWDLCISQTKDLPEGDRILSLYLSITKDEESFIKTANFRSVSTRDEFNERIDLSPEAAQSPQSLGGESVFPGRIQYENQVR
jgi:hypothetical protein